MSVLSEIILFIKPLSLSIFKCLSIVLSLLFNKEAIDGISITFDSAKLTD